MGATRSGVSAPAAMTSTGAVKRPSDVSSNHAPAAGAIDSTVAIRTSTRRPIAAMAACGSPMYPSSGQYEPPTIEAGSRPSTSAAASPGETTREGTPASFWTRTFLRSRASASSVWATNR